jgi:hypothetical protein
LRCLLRKKTEAAYPFAVILVYPKQEFVRAV